MVQRLYRTAKQRIVNSVAHRGVVAVVLAAAVGVGVAMCLTGPQAAQWVGLAALVLLIGGMVAAQAVVAGWDWLAPPVLFVVIFGLYFVARPMGLLAGLKAIAGAGAGAQASAAIAIAFVAAVGFWVGYLLPIGKALGVSIPWVSREWSAQRTRVAVWLCWGLGLICWVVMMRASGGIIQRLTTYGQGTAAGIGVVVVGSAALLGVALAGGWLAYWKGVISRIELIVITTTGAGMLLVHGQRAAALVPLLMIVTIYHYEVRAIRARQIILLGLVAALIVVGVGLPRLRIVHAAEVALPARDYATVGGWLLLRNLTAFDALMLVTEKVPRQIDYQWGRTYVDALAMIVPRWLYEGKAQRNLFNRLLRPRSSGSMALTLPAEGYLNFGGAGLLLETLLLGVLYRALYSYRGQHSQNEAAVLGYALAVPFFALFWRGGLMGGHLGYLLAYGGLVVLLALFCAGSKWVVGVEGAGQAV